MRADVGLDKQARPAQGRAGALISSDVFGSPPHGRDDLTGKLDEFEYFFDKEWSDGFPMVTPTEERIQWMLSGTQRRPDEPVGSIPPAMEPATVRTVAIHALMAGCKPEYLPVLLGAVPLMLRKEFNLNGVQGTMGPVAPLMIVNGPYAKQIGLHGGNG